MLQIEILDILVVNQNLTFLTVVEAQHQAGNRRFTWTAVSNDGHRLVRFNYQIEVA